VGIQKLPDRTLTDAQAWKLLLKIDEKKRSQRWFEQNKNESNA